MPVTLVSGDFNKIVCVKFWTSSNVRSKDFLHKGTLHIVIKCPFVLLQVQN